MFGAAWILVLSAAMAAQGAQPAQPAETAPPTPKVVCGLTILPAPRMDEKMVKEIPRRAFTMRTVQPRVCHAVPDVDVPVIRERFRLPMILPPRR